MSVWGPLQYQREGKNKVDSTRPQSMITPSTSDYNGGHHLSCCTWAQCAILKNMWSLCSRMQKIIDKLLNSKLLNHRSDSLQSLRLPFLGFRLEDTGKCTKVTTLPLWCQIWNWLCGRRSLLPSAETGNTGWEARVCKIKHASNKPPGSTYMCGNWSVSRIELGWRRVIGSPRSGRPTSLWFWNDAAPRRWTSGSAAAAGETGGSWRCCWTGTRCRTGGGGEGG